MIDKFTNRLNCPHVSCRQKCLSISCVINIVFSITIMLISAAYGKTFLCLVGFAMSGINIYDLFMSPIPVARSTDTVVEK